ncbi:MAG: homocysteine biosynthesis protein [Dehalococcoidia bacterium]|nr:homocysteine biosynthesis protein [Dehalococcoidia bacterium]MDH4299598.1 homocysteine biosynthesis protein [Dehalococcoidia bacterium]MDH4366805.1 homocysteine biosynthesis protein [Dehalococcoidia bacterium]
MAKTITEINEKIRKGRAVVVTAEEVIDIAREKGVRKAAEEIDVVTTGTFSPMCGSGAFLNIGHSKPRIKLGGGKVYLNDVPVYTGIAAVDVFIGATALPDDDPRNKFYPGEFNYGGGYVMQELVSGKDIRLTAAAFGTDCYPRKKLETLINIKDINEAILFNVRNAYQNYNVAVNLSDKVRYTYMGVLKPNLGNANYCSAGQLSPLLNDPYYKTIGVGTRIFLGGGTGYVAWHGTQHSPTALRGDNGVPRQGAGTLAVIGDLKQMKPEWLVGTSMLGYGCTLTVGIGVPIPILSEEIFRYTTVSDAGIMAPIVDYSEAYPQREPDIVAEVSYAELRSGHIKVQGKDVPTSSLSSYPKAVEIASILKQRIEEGEFLLTEPVAPLPGVESGISFKPLKERPIS